MKTFSVESLPRRSVCIGRTGENGYTSLSFDVSAWLEQYPDARVTVVYRRPDGVSYIVASGQEGSSTVVWTVSECDLAVEGYGEVELRLTQGEVVGKSERVSLKVKASLTAGERPSSPVHDWVNRLLGRITRAEQQTATASQSACRAAEVAADAKEACQAAQGDCLSAQEYCQTVQGEVAQAGERALDILRQNEAYATVDVFAGAVRGSRAGECVVHLDDVSAVPGTLSCYAYGKNLIPYPYFKQGATNGGLTYTVQEDGGIAVEGSVQGSMSSFDLYVGGFPLPPGTYTVGGHSGGVQVAVRQMVNGAERSFSYAGADTRTLSEEAVIGRISLYVPGGTEIPAGTVIYPTLSRGGEALPFVKGEAISLRTCGKNLFDISKVLSSAAYENRVTNNQDGSLTVVLGNSTSVHGSRPCTLRDYAPGLRVGETYTLSAITISDIPAKPQGNYIYLTEAKQSWFFGKSMTVTEKMLGSRVNWYIYGAVDVYGEGTIKDIQIEAGTVATKYEPYAEGEILTARQGEATSIVAISPCMSVISGQDTAVYVKYNKDLGVVLDRMEKAIISLGGNV